ncbi:hypothetical protein WICMUC_002284 [Wickerhamomyces mucosus]|uniref:Mitochondrial glycine transporter n=1 Tax=Wickerhamomyces mucosus TaxID=1378264 RepID=A0A9P8PPE6_9ASCO|nr:hypothetical protein WICMUC_002284 [Wickerhamomyces mucosus]
MGVEIEIHCGTSNMSNSTKKNYSHLIGGFFGGLASSVTLQPFDLIKTRVQQNQNSTLLGTIKGLRNIKELWRGTLPSALRTSVGSGLYLASLNIFRTALANSKTHKLGIDQLSSSSLPKLSGTENLITGSLTRGFVGWLTMPITIIKVRYESTLYNYNSMDEAIRSIFKKEGVKGFFSGFIATAARDAPYAGIYVLLYEKMKIIAPKLIYFEEGDSSSKNLRLFSTTTSALINSISAFAAASLSTTITAPFDTIKTRMQLNPKKFNSFWRTFNYIPKEEGIIRLFDGLSLRLTRKAFSAGIAWGIYEEIVKNFDDGIGKRI